MYIYMLLLMESIDHLPISFIMDCMNNYPPGFRFYPTDEELINDYLKKKISVTSSNPFVSMIAEVDLYKFDPWQLPGKAYFGDKEWFFFSPRDRKYLNGDRPNRAAVSGYWKATGIDKPILSRYSQCIGVMKALVFYEGRPPMGNKTSWMMYEYRLIDKVNHCSSMHKGSMRLDDWVLCRIRQKTVIQLLKPEGNVKKKAKRAYGDMFEALMEDEFFPDDISSLQTNEWQPQHYHQANNQAMMHDFQEKSSSSHSISYDNFDYQMNTNESMNESLEVIGEVAPNQPNKKVCYVDSSSSLDNISDIINELQSESSTY